MDTLAELYSLALEPGDFVRASGEALASIHRRAMTDHSLLAEFALVGLAHIDALELCGLNRDALGAAVSILIAIDMTKADCGNFEAAFVKLHTKLLLQSARLKQETENDQFAAPHAKAILEEAAVLFLLSTPSENSNNYEIEGLRKGCAKIGAAHEGDYSELLVDIFSRLHALS